MIIVFNIVESIVSLRVFFFLYIYTFLEIFGPTSTEMVFSKKYSEGRGERENNRLRVDNNTIDVPVCWRRVYILFRLL